mmetsp:Transcript_60462/g.187248  ORF Transcript_60462/g.187248 Transcript_60462/m.187248 type:complete len:149 (+) Transcript_60462:66-512(+)
MSRSRCLLCMAAAAVAAVQLGAPRAFVPAARTAGSAAAAAAGVAAAGSLASFPAWAYGPEAVDMQLLLARIPGGKMTKERNLVVPSPEEDGFTDAQVALCLAIALVAALAAWDLAKGLQRGLRPIKDKTLKSKGRITPLVKRFIEMGY